MFSTPSIALFRIRETNRAMSDPTHPGFDIGTAQSRGVELRLNGEILPGGSFSADGYVVGDAHVGGYELSKTLDARLSVTNVADTKYISSLTTGGIGTYYGDPRKVLFTLKVRY